MTKIDQLIATFKEFKEELNKNMNGSMNPGMHQPNATTGTSGGQGGMYRSECAGGAQDMMALKFEKNGQWRLDKVDPQENINIPHPKGKAKMADGVNKDESYVSTDGKNREANPKLRQSDMGPGGKVHMIRKDEGTNEESNPTHPHNKGKFKVMDMAEEKSMKHAEATGKPYNGKDKDVKKGEECPKCGKTPCKCVDKSQKGHIQGNESKGNDENKAPGRGTLGV